MRFRTTATLAALYCNAHLPPGDKRVTPEDFVPGQKGEREEGPVARMAREAAWVEAWSRGE